MIIRDAEIKDFNRIYELNQEFARLYNAEDKLTLEKDQLIKDRDLFKCRVAIVDDIIVGFTTYFTAYYTWVGKAIYLDDLFVTEEYRGRNIGDKLLDDVIEVARQNHCVRVVWQVSEWNKKAQKFYLNKGAKIDSGELNCIFEI